MSPRTETFYILCSGNSAKQNELQLQMERGSTQSGIQPVYSDRQLTKQVGTLKFDGVLLDNSKSISVISIENTITTDDGTISYSFIRSNYNKITVETQQTSGKYTQGTITRSYEGEDKELRKIVYRSTF